MKRSIRSSIPRAAIEEAKFVDGRKVSAKYFLNGEFVGRRCWNGDGVLIWDQAFRNGRPYGTFRNWHDNGQLEWEEPFRKGLVHGVCRQWDMNGKLIGSYRMNMGTGADLWWGGDGGSPSEERHYLDGRRHGFERWWIRKNEIYDELHFHHGLEHGVFRHWTNGKLTRGYPKFYIHGKKVTKRAYIAASARDATLPPYIEKDNSPRRKPIHVPSL